LVKTSRVSNDVGPFATAYSEDNGISWTSIDTQLPIASFHFLDEQTGWGGKFQNDGSSTVMYRYVGDAITSLSGPEVLTLDWQLSPNPTSGLLHLSIRSPEPTELQIRLYSNSGQLVKQGSLDAATVFEATLDLEPLPRGVYTLVLQSQEGHTVGRKVLKQ
ncbi:MAG: T9SS type A sorting domain-containing protein, partial [Bacteroidota bacterium]